MDLPQAKFDVSRKWHIFVGVSISGHVGFISSSQDNVSESCGQLREFTARLGKRKVVMTHNEFEVTSHLSHARFRLRASMPYIPAKTIDSVDWTFYQRQHIILFGLTSWMRRSISLQLCNFPDSCSLSRQVVLQQPG
jgi:hypothetical protein